MGEKKSWLSDNGRAVPFLVANKPLHYLDLWKVLHKQTAATILH